MVHSYCGAWWASWRIGRVDAFRPEGRGFEGFKFRSSRHVRILGKSFTCCCLYKLQHSCCGRERFCKAHAVRSAIEMDKYNTILYIFYVNTSIIQHQAFSSVSPIIWNGLPFLLPKTNSWTLFSCGFAGSASGKSLEGTLYEILID